MAQLIGNRYLKFSAADAAVFFYSALFFWWSWFQPKP
jgi:hypothetical protein